MAELAQVKEELALVKAELETLREEAAIGVRLHEEVSALRQQLRLVRDGVGLARRRGENKIVVAAPHVVE